MLFSGRPGKPSLAKFTTWFKTKTMGWELTVNDRPLTPRDWALLVTHNFTFEALECWEDNVVKTLELTEWQEEIPRQDPAMR